MEKSILMKTWEVQAVLDNRKTQKRIVVKPQPKESHAYKLGFITDSTDKTRIGKFSWGTSEYGGVISLAKPPYQVGDILWVKETWCDVGTIYKFPTNYIYRASPELCPENCPCAFKGKWHDSGCLKPTWKPSIHMPKEAARIWLKVTDVRVERLQDITADEIRNEGLASMAAHCGDMEIALKELKNVLKCNDNDWAWAITFERIDKQ